MNKAMVTGVTKKVIDEGRTAGDIWVKGKYLYVSTVNGTYRLLIYKITK